MKAQINDAIRKYVHEHLTPTPDEREQVTRIYQALKSCLGESRCIQIGSYARFTAIRPPHDLDVLYTIGAWPGTNPDPQSALKAVEQLVRTKFVNPTSFSLQISLQTHSVCVSFYHGAKEVFAVDIVPAYEHGQNEFKEPMYMVPELLRSGHATRRRIYADIAQGRRGAISWIRSDPRGYTSVAAGLNAKNEDFRRAVKFVKGWRAAEKSLNPGFALKAFHAEQVITRRCLQVPGTDVGDAVLDFFQRLRVTMTGPQIADRADPNVCIDEYLRSLTPAERQAVVDAGDRFWQALQDVSSVADLHRLLQSGGGPVRAPSPARVAAPATAIRSPSRPWAN